MSLVYFMTGPDEIWVVGALAMTLSLFMRIIIEWFRSEDLQHKFIKLTVNDNHGVLRSR